MVDRTVYSKHHCDDMVLGIIICAYNAKIKYCTVQNVIFLNFDFIIRNYVTQNTIGM